MKRFTSLFVLTFTVIISLTARDLNYTQQWKTIEETIEQGLPETALKELKILRATAVQKGNLQQEVKASLYEFRIRAEKDPSQLAQVINEAEQFSASLRQSPERMLMYLMLAEVYGMHLNRNQFRLSDRSTIRGTSDATLLPSNLEEWSREEFQIKIDQMLQLAFQDTLLLQQRRITADDAFIVADTLQFQSATTLYDLMLLKAFEIEQLWENKKDRAYWFQRHLTFRRSQPEIFPLVLAELRMVQHQLSLRGYTEAARKLQLQSLDSLENCYINHPEVVEILSEKANLYVNDDKTVGNKRIAYRICEEGIRRYPDYPRIHLLKNTQFTIETKTVRLHSPLYFSSGKPITVQLSAANTSRLKVSIHRVNSSALQYHLFKEQNSSYSGQKPFPDAALVDSQWIELPYNPDFAEVQKELTFKGMNYGIYELRAVIPGIHQMEKMPVVRTSTNHSKVMSSPDPSVTEEIAIAHFTVTDLIAIRRPINKDSMLVVVADRASGKPQSGVQTTLFERKWQSTAGYVTNELSRGISSKEGKVVLSGSNLLNLQTPYLQLSKGEDRFFMGNFMNNFYSFNEAVPTSNRTVSLFTDRGIYRPGQVLQYKAIVYQSDKNTEKVIADTLIEVSIYDANNSKVGSHQLKTNDFGSVSGSFVLPSNSLNGIFILKSGNTRLRVRVEEYKRPTFDVSIAGIDKEYRFGESISFNGKATAFAGYPLQQAQVKYTVHRRMMSFFRWYPWFNNEKELVAEGTTSTGTDGNFSLSFIPHNSSSRSSSGKSGSRTLSSGRSSSQLDFYTYEIEADVTALHGESQQGKTSVSVGDRSLLLASQLPEKVEKSTTLQPLIILQNLNGKPISKLISYELSYLRDDGKFREREQDTDLLLWKNPGEAVETDEPVLMLKGSLISTDSLRLKLHNFRSGKYRLQLYTLDSTGDTVRAENTFILYGADVKKPAVQSYAWLTSKNITAAPGNNIDVPFGTSLKNAWILYEVNFGARVLEQKWVRLSNRIKKFKVSFEEQYKEGLTVRFMLIHDGKVFHRTVEIKSPEVQKLLTPQLTVFRDKLRPGSDEQWKVTIPNVPMVPRRAELLAGMYDASLDQFMPFSWQFYPNYERAVPSAVNWDYRLSNNSQGRWQYMRPYLQGIDYSTANLEFYSASSALAGYEQRYFMRSKVERNEGPVKTMMTGAIEDNESVFIRGLSPGNSVMNEVVIESQAVPPVRIRENFNETAFFYPQLHADTAGHFTINFTLPESLTRWKLKLLAHSPDLYTGQKEYTFVSQKELMVNMNLPRFIRQSDEWELQATVVNLTDQLLHPVVKLLLLNPTTDELIEEVNLQEQSLRLEGKGQSQVRWKIPSLLRHDLVVCRIEARSGSFSDGEQRYLPILSDRILVTESVPFVVQEGKTTEVQLSNLPSTAEIKQISLEFTANPAWTALYALPLLSVPESDNAIDLLGAWYSGAVGLKLLQANPIIKKIFKELALKELTEGTFQSQLEKNPDLKMMVLKATPWLLDAANQTHQQRELIRLLDEPLLRTNLTINLEKLRKLQLPSGAFAWMAGMPENRYITQLVTEKLVRINRDSIYSGDLMNLIRSSIGYLDSKLAEDFEHLKRWNRNYKENKTISTLQLHYMTLRALLPEVEVTASTLEAYLYFNDQIIRYRHSFPAYEKAFAAQYLHRSGQTVHASQLLRSLREQSVSDPLKGMYWPRLRAGWMWNERPLTIHTRILEAITELEGSSSATEQMKAWLLNQKHTTSWDSRLTTLEAVMALLNSGEPWLSKTQNYSFQTGAKTQPAAVNQMTMKASGTSARFPLTTLKTESPLPGSGYFRATLPADVNLLCVKQLSNETSHLQVLTAPARGALYRQSLQQIDQLKASGKELSVSRSYYYMATDKTLIPIPLNPALRTDAVSSDVKNMEMLVSTEGSLPTGAAGSDKKSMEMSHPTSLTLKPGDKIISRLIITAAHDFEYVVLRDNKSATLEAVNPMSGCEFKEGLLLYRSAGDQSTDYYIEHLPRGKYILEESYYLTHAGDFSSGVAQIQCLYAAEYTGNSTGTRLKISVKPGKKE